MVIYQATNQSCSPKAVSEAHSPEKRCSHLDIHKGKKAEKEKKGQCLRPSAASFGFCGVEKSRRMRYRGRGSRLSAGRWRRNQEATVGWGIYASSYDAPAVKNLDSSQQLMKQ